jgi:hypothetical protein
LMTNTVPTNRSPRTAHTNQRVSELREPPALFPATPRSRYSPTDDQTINGPFISTASFAPTCSIRFSQLLPRK